MNTRFSKHGFTLIELIIVIVIIGILASIAAPMMRAVKVKAICAEAVAVMGTIRTALRAYYAEYGNYPPIVKFSPFDNPVILNNLTDVNFSNYFPGLKKGDLTGTYFGKECYWLRSNVVHSGRCNIGCVIDYDVSAPRASEAITIEDEPGGILSMDVVSGELTQQLVSKSGFKPMSE